MTRRIAIVGAGVAGCAAAYRLRDADASVTVFEPADEPGGRAATRRREGCVYDVGANYLSVEDGRVQALVDGPLADDLVAVDGDVWTVDADGEIGPGRDADEPKLTGRSGVATIGERLIDRADATVDWGTRVVGLDADAEDGTNAERVAEAGEDADTGHDGAGEERWILRIESGAGGDPERTGPFDEVALTPPAPLTAELLAGVPVAESLREAARSIAYRSITTVACRYDHPVDWPYYALVDVSKSRDLGWVAREECKPGHVPGGSLLILQASPAWSREHANASDADVAEAASDLVATLVDDTALADPVWSDVARFPHALTDDGLPDGVRREAADAGIHVAGDWVAGESRLDAALLSGLGTADRLGDRG